MPAEPRVPTVISIAGSDSGGGAGIQADLKTFSALGVYGASVVTALTSQNTKGVTGIHDVPPDFIAAQIDAVFSDLDVRAAKTGFIGKAGYCLATLLRLPNEGRQVAVVVLGARSNAGRFMETRNLFGWLSAKASTVFATKASSVFATEAVIPAPQPQQ